MAREREIAEGLQDQGVDEIVVYTLTTTNAGSSPSSPVVVVKDESNSYADVTTTVMSTNSPTISGDVITLSPLELLTENHIYRVEIKFVIGSSTLEHYARVKATL